MFGMLIGGYLKLAIGSIKSAKWRSMLTMLGIVIGVASVVTIVSLGEGVKQEVSRQINQSGADLITILPGQRVKRDSSGKITGSNSLLNQAGTSFSDADYKIVRQIKQAKPVVPFGKVVGLVQSGDNSYPKAEVIATTEDTAGILNHRLEYGSFYKDDEVSGNGAVIGRRVAEQLFKENVPIGKSFTLRNQEFVVRGIFEEFVTNTSLLSGADYNNTVFIPYKIGQELMGGNIQVYQILARPAQGIQINTAIKSINDALKQQRAGQEDFSILKQEENLALANNVLSMLTNLISAVAAISLLVGGIGIMNIMLVAVTERTHEIGIRKAVGATNSQILYQFITEAAVLSLSGGLLGIMLSIFANVMLRILTDLKPVITLPVVGLAGGVALVVGMFFGVAPALKAAHKDPITALRHE